MGLTKRDNMASGSGKILNEDDSTYDFTAGFRALAVAVATLPALAVTAVTRLTSILVQVSRGLQDAMSGAMVGTINGHSKIHNGQAFHTRVSASGGSGTKATITFLTPNSNSWMHVIVHYRCNVESVARLGEGATVTAASGSDLPIPNRNRNSSTISEVSGAGSAGGAGNVTIGATVTNFGTILGELHIGNGKSGGEARGDDEWILKPNTVYVLETESEATGSEISVEMDWYEVVSLG